MDVEGRRLPDPVPGDREVLVQWLEWQRATVVAKCAGLDETRSRTALVPTSPLTIRGVVSHLTDVEQHWMVRSFAGRPEVEPASDGGFHPPGARTLAQLVEDYRGQCAQSRRIAAAHELDTSERWCPEGLPRVTLRWILGHLGQETARHLGHLDLLCEAADGRRGY